MPLTSANHSLVYIVDDDVSVLRALQRLLKSAGFAVESFNSAEAFRQGNPDPKGACLLLDVQLPGVDGINLQKDLAASDWKMPIVFLTAHENTGIRDRAMEAGAVAFLTKPVDDKALLEAIRLALKAHAP